MKTSTDTSPKTRRKLPVPLIILALIAVAGAALAAAWSYQTRNYAEQVARPLEKSLADVGGVKKCSRGAEGRGPDNFEPWYYAIYEVPGDRKAAASLVRDAFKKNGYTLTDGPTPGNPEDNLFYGDKISKHNPYQDLEPGPIDLRLTVFGSKTYNEGGAFCGVTGHDDPPTDKSTIRFTINLPAFKGK